jgi:hypothetical protein
MILEYMYIYIYIYIYDFYDLFETSMYRCTKLINGTRLETNFGFRKKKKKKKKETNFDKFSRDRKSLSM